MAVVAVADVVTVADVEATKILGSSMFGITKTAYIKGDQV